MTMSLGNKILELRKKKGLSQEQLGEKVDVTRQTISNWENDNIQPSIDMLIKIADYFRYKPFLGRHSVARRGLPDRQAVGTF